MHSCLEQTWVHGWLGVYDQDGPLTTGTGLIRGAHPYLLLPAALCIHDSCNLMRVTKLSTVAGYLRLNSFLKCRQRRGKGWVSGHFEKTKLCLPLSQDQFLQDQLSLDQLTWDLGWKHLALYPGCWLGYEAKCFCRWSWMMGKHLAS